VRGIDVPWEWVYPGRSANHAHAHVNRDGFDDTELIPHAQLVCDTNYHADANINATGHWQWHEYLLTHSNKVRKGW